MPIPRMEITDIEAVFEREVLDGGRISGLSEYEGRRVMIVVTTEGERRKKGLP